MAAEAENKKQLTTNTETTTDTPKKHYMKTENHIVITRRIRRQGNNTITQIIIRNITRSRMIDTKTVHDNNNKQGGTNHETTTQT